MRSFLRMLLPVVLVGVLGVPAATAPAPQAGAFREVAEAVLARFAREGVEETVETLAARLARISARHGDEAVRAVEKVGPRAARWIEDAGEHGSTVASLLLKQGDEAAWVASEPARLALAARWGDDATEAMIRHKSVADPLVRELGAPAARALGSLDGQAARRLAILQADGDLARIGRTPELLGVVERFGDRALDFIWRHKGILATGTVLAAFLSDPEPFLDGTRAITAEVGEALAVPLTEGARTMASRHPWVLVAAVALALGCLTILVRGILPRRR